MKRILTVAACVISALSVALLASSQREMPTSVQCGDHRLRMQVTGHGSPYVVLETFGPAYLEIWNRIQPEIAKFAKVVSYDHAGYWGSEPGKKPRDARTIAMELHRALSSAGVPPPYLLVGYSFGGPYVRVFADLFPDDVCGIVFIDPAQERFSKWLTKHFPEMNVVTAEDEARADEWGAQWASLEQARNAKLPRVPLTLVSAAQPGGILLNRLLPEWLRCHREWLASYPWARHVITTNSSHGIFFTQPELVTTVVREMVEEIRE